MPDIFDIPKNVYIAVLSDWLTCPTISVLDSAFCNMSQRQQHLQLCSQSSVYGIVDYLLTNNLYLDWIVSKGLEMGVLRVFLQNLDSENIIKNLKCDKLKGFQFLQGPIPTVIDEMTILNSLPSKFRTLSVFSCHRVTFITDEVVKMFFNACPLLQTVELSQVDVTDDAIVFLAEHCTHLKVLSVKKCNIGKGNGVTIDSVGSIVNCCTDIQRITFDMFEYLSVDHSLKINSTAKDPQLAQLVEIFPDIKGLNLVLEKLSLKALVLIKDKLYHCLEIFEMRICSKSLVEIEAHMIEIAKECQQLKRITLNCDLLISGIITVLNLLPHLTLIKTKTIMYNTEKQSLELKSHSGTQLSDSELVQLVDYGFIINDIGCITLEDCPKLTDIGLMRVAETFTVNLKQLTILQCGSITDAGLIELLTKCSELKHLNVSNCKLLTSKSCKNLPEQCLNMQHFSWSNYDQNTKCPTSHLSHSTIIQMSQLWQQLQTVKMLGAHIVKYTSLAMLISECTHLTTIETSHLEYNKSENVRISNNNESDVDNEFLQIIRSCIKIGKPVKEIRVSNCSQVTDHAVQDTLCCQSSHLVELHVTGCRLVTEAGIHTLMNAQCDMLRSVSVFGITASNNMYLVNLLRNCPKLHDFQNDHIKLCKFENSLTIKGNNVTNHEVVAILSCMDKLHGVEITGMTILSDDTVIFAAKKFGRQLSSVTLKQCDALTDHMVTTLVTNCVELAKLELLDCLLLGNEVVKVVAKHCTLLQSFSLGCATRMPEFDEDFVKLIETCSPLKYLFVTAGEEGANTLKKLIAERGLRLNPKLEIYE